MLRAALAPADDRTTLEALARMSTLVARRNAGDDDAELTLACFAERLRAYPADFVLDALEDWPNRSQWWPTWYELRDRLEQRTQRRRDWLDDVDLIERMLETPRIAPDPEAERRRAETEQAEHTEVSGKFKALVVHLNDRRNAG